MIISYYPERSTFLEYMKQNLDEGVYDRSEYAQPNLPTNTIKGEEADPGVVTIYNGDSVMGVVLADSDGNFSFTFDVVYEQSYQIRAEDSGGNKSNILDFELFNYVTLLYIISLRMNEIRKQIAQRKQDIYVEDKVGDSFESLFFVDQNVFQTRLLTLMDKFVYGDITDYLNEEERDIYTKDNVSKSMKISEFGCLIKSLNYLKEIFISLLNDSGLEIYLYPQSDFGTVLRMSEDSREESIYAVSGTTDTIFIPSRGERHRFTYNLLALSGGGEMTITGSGYYHWIYIDGDLDPIDGVWEVKQSEIQPLPITINRVETHLTASIYTDTTGNITGLVNQRYIIVDKQVLRDETYTVYDPNSNEMDITLLGGKIIALGVFEDLTSVQAVYKTSYEPKILAVVKTDSGGDIEKVQRTYDEPDHSEVGSLQLEKDTNIFIKTGKVLSGKEKDLVSLCTSTLLPVNMPKNIFIDKYNLIANPFVSDGDGIGGALDWNPVEITGAGMDFAWYLANDCVPEKFNYIGTITMINVTESIIITNPPSYQNSQSTFRNFECIDVKGNYLYAVDDARYLFILEIDNDGNLTEKSVNLVSATAMGHMHVVSDPDNDVIYVCGSRSNPKRSYLFKYDISDPTNPIEIDTLTIIWSGFGYSFNIEFGEGKLFVPHSVDDIIKVYDGDFNFLYDITIGNGPERLDYNSNLNLLAVSFDRTVQTYLISDVSGVLVDTLTQMVGSYGDWGLNGLSWNENSDKLYTINYYNDGTNHYEIKAHDSELNELQSVEIPNSATCMACKDNKNVYLWIDGPPYYFRILGEDLATLKEFQTALSCPDIYLEVYPEATGIGIRNKHG